MSKITYENKVAINVNSDIADINKCNASDLNEIKQVVNTNDDNTTNNSNAIGTLSSLNTTNKSNLVGAINSIVESGSNENGSWIKWVDGTMICYLSRGYSANEDFGADGSIFLKDFDGWTFPKPFIVTPFVQVTNRSASALRRTWTYCSGNISNTNIEKIGIITYWNASSADGVFYLLAIGKWK